MKDRRFIAVGAAACVACCIGPILGALGAVAGLGLITAAIIPIVGFGITGAAIVAFAVIRRKRQTCAVEGAGTPVRLTTHT